MRSLRSWLVCFTLPFIAAACADVDEIDAADHHDDGLHEEEEVGVSASALSTTSPVSAAVTQSCSTTSVKALAVQLVEEINCLKPGAMKRIDDVPGLALGSAVFPYLQTPAADALVAAQKARGVRMTINSGLRTLPQQYLLYRWYKTGRCGISLAAKPGTSNHESGIAVDIADNASWRSTMKSKGYRWLGASDPVHFDYVGGRTVNMKGLSVLAFQRLWNRNNPSDRIAEDGVYGPATEARLAKAPVGGFAKGAVCTPGARSSEIPPELDIEIDGADTPVIPDATEPGDELAPDTTTSMDAIESLESIESTGSNASAESDDESDGSIDAIDEPARAADGGCSAVGARRDSGVAGSMLLVGAAALAIGRRRRASCSSNDTSR